MKLFFKYLSTKKYPIILVFSFVLFFAFSFMLYELPVKAVIYPAIVSAIFGVFFLLIDFINVKRKHEELLRLLSQPSETLNLPKAGGDITAEDYSLIVEKLKKDTEELSAKASNDYDDMIDYYTAWAHQIKTPIASMKLSLENEDSELSRKLSSDLRRMQAYVDMVLAFLRLGSDSSDYVFKKISLDDIIKPSLKKFAPDFIGKKLSLSYEPIRINVLTDEKWFSFLFEQILSNAIKYTKEGGISIYMEDGRKLVIEDTGIGIAPEDVNRVFEKGYMGINGRKNREASGLGLYLCKVVSDKLGLDISLESLVKKGTKVYLYFPDDRIHE
ncbi:MAG: sensor histidine kinase [Lachnospiraceae bacterium]|nr:sensor histidine kinase [Lachnospiraceae bacterium]